MSRERERKRESKSRDRNTHEIRRNFPSSLHFSTHDVCADCKFQTYTKKAKLVRESVKPFHPMCNPIYSSLYWKFQLGEALSVQDRKRYLLLSPTSVGSCFANLLFPPLHTHTLVVKPLTDNHMPTDNIVRRRLIQFSTLYIFSSSSHLVHLFDASYSGNVILTRLTLQPIPLVHRICTVHKVLTYASYSLLHSWLIWYFWLASKIDRPLRESVRVRRRS